ncbi:MAG: hypothetical protein QXU93_11735 [Thermoproteus sp.]
MDPKDVLGKKLVPVVITGRLDYIPFSVVKKRRIPIETVTPFAPEPKIWLDISRILRIGRKDDRYYFIYLTSNTDYYAYYSEKPPEGLEEVAELKRTYELCPDGRELEWDADEPFCSCCPDEEPKTKKLEVVIWRRPSDPPAWSEAAVLSPPLRPEETDENTKISWALFEYHAKQLLGGDKFARDSPILLRTDKEEKIGAYIVKEGPGFVKIDWGDYDEYCCPGYYRVVELGKFRASKMLRDMTEEEAMLFAEREPYWVAQLLSGRPAERAKEILAQEEFKRKVKEVQRIYKKMQEGTVTPSEKELEEFKQWSEEVYKQAGVDKAEFLRLYEQHLHAYMKKMEEKERKTKETKERILKELEPLKDVAEIRDLSGDTFVALHVNLKTYLPKKKFEEVTSKLKSLGFKWSWRDKEWVFFYDPE